ncbi:MAG: ATPase [Oligoflexia bacterium]|nr:MAG: ATPase [Oligoflexia bacterium]
MRLIMLLLAGVAAVMGLLGPLLQKEFVDQVLSSPSTFQSILPLDFQSFSPLSLLIGAFICLLISLVCSQLVNFLGAREAVIVQKKWAQELYLKILDLRTDTLEGRPVGELVSVYATDVPSATVLLEQSIPQGAGIIFPLLVAPLAIITIFQIPWFPTYSLILGISALNFFLAYRQSRFFFQFKKLAADRISLVSEWIQNIRYLRILSWVPAFEKKIFSVRENETANRIRMLTNGQTMNGIASSVTFFLNLAAIGALVYYQGDHVTPGSLLALLWIVGVFLTRPFRMMPWFFTFIFDAWTSLRRMSDVYLLENSEPYKRHKNFDKMNFRRPEHLLMKVQNLNLHIGQHHILKNINFELREKELLAVVGEVGSGKSLLLLSLLGETGATFDQYQIDGNDGRTIHLDQLRQYFTYVPQEGFIMSASLRENVAFEYDIGQESDNAIRTSLRRAQLDYSQERLTQGLDTLIGERGVNLSGGQKQRVSLARVDFFPAPIVLLDDSLSAVDVDTENKLIESLIDGAWRERGRILVTHRLTVLDKVDRIIFLDQGEIKGIGTYQELLGSNSQFREYAASVARNDQ